MLIQSRSARSERVRTIQAKLPEHVEGEVLVKLNHADDQLVHRYGARVTERIDLPGSPQELLRLQLPPGMTTAEAIAQMSEDPAVAYAASNDILRRTDVPADLDLRLWGLSNQGQQGGTVGADIDASGAWSVHTGSRHGAVVAVVDTGVDYQHPNLRQNIWTNPSDGSHGYNAIVDSHDPMDDDSHGTHCTGTIAAQGQAGVYGINWQAQVMPIKFLGADGGGKTSDAIKGLAWAARHGARITNNSWGGTRYNEAMRDALSGSPCLHVFAAGNDNENNDVVPYYPASYDLPNVIAVAASDRRDQKGMFSNVGVQSVHLAAPGVAIYSTVPGGQYESMDGTSMAAPHVAGAAALIASAYPEASNEQIRTRLLSSTDALPDWQSRVSSGGRLNLARAIRRDEVAPGRPEAVGLSVEPGQARLQVVCSGDDGAQGGPAAAHQVRYSDRPIVEGPAGPGQVSFDQAVAVKAPRPLDPGESQQISFPIPLSQQEKPLHVAFRSSDAAGNTSPLQSLTATAPAARLAFEDRDDPAQWQMQGSWGLEVVPGRGSVWSDSPGGTYSNNANLALTSKPVSLDGLRGARLSFESRHATEEKYDGCAVEVSRDGHQWEVLDDYTGKAGWSQRSYDLSGYDGQVIQFRFRLHTDASGYRDGVYFDNVAISGSAVAG
jgi:hypothetical protein